VVRRISEALNESGKPLNRAAILIVGVTCEKDTTDLGESPALEIIEQCQKRSLRFLLRSLCAFSGRERFADHQSEI